MISFKEQAKNKVLDLSALKRAKGNKTQAAKARGVILRTYMRRLARYKKQRSKTTKERS